MAKCNKHVMQNAMQYIQGSNLKNRINSQKLPSVVSKKTCCSQKIFGFADHFMKNEEGFN